jgi:hypothetical protein
MCCAGIDGAREWVTDHRAEIVGLFHGDDKNMAEEAGQLLALFLPEINRSPGLLREVLGGIPSVNYAQATEMVVLGMCEFVRKEASVENCECVCAVLARVLMMTPVQRKCHRVKNEAFRGVFRALVAGLGLGIEDFEADDAGRRRIAAALAVLD